jgi:CRISPR-associated protein Cmr1
VSNKVRVKVTFNTITPLWTGDAWQDNREIRPSSLLGSLSSIRPSSLFGSLRFWFEVICYFSGICSEEDFDKKTRRFEKEVNRKDFKNCLLKKGNSFKAKIECLKKQNVPLPSIIFGTTNWRSLIEIKSIKILSKFVDYKFPIGQIRFPELKHNNKIPTWFFKKGFYGKFSVIFKIEKDILEPIFYPLLTFMEQYGYWGGKWNLGYGRLEIEDVVFKDEKIDNWKKEEFDLSIFYEDKNERLNFNFGELTEIVKDFENLTKRENIIKVLYTISSRDIFKEIIKILIQQRSQERANFRENTEERHKIFGKTGNPRRMPYVPQASKILPYIKKTERDKFPYDCGFLSIAGLLNLEYRGENND